MKLHTLFSLSVVTSFSLFGGIQSFAQEASVSFPPIEVSYAELKAVDLELDQKLEAAHYEGIPSHLKLIVRQTNEGLNEFEVEESQTAELSSDKPTTLKQIKSLWVAGVVLSTAYIKGVGLSYLHYNPQKGKVIYHFDTSVSGNGKIGNFTLSVDPHIGKSGVFAGVNGQVFRFQTDLIDNSVPLYLWGVGVETGWQKAWGANQKIVTRLKVGMVGIYENEFVYLLPEASVGIGIRINRK